MKSEGERERRKFTKQAAHVKAKALILNEEHSFKRRWRARKEREGKKAK